jgi:hypothetical protein
MTSPGKFDTQAALDLATIGASVAQIAELEETITDTVRRLRARFVPWADIAEELGTTRQAAQQRYGSELDRRDARHLGTPET